jgi:hypothetical protein
MCQATRAGWASPGQTLRQRIKRGEIEATMSGADARKVCASAQLLTTTSSTKLQPSPPHNEGAV